jgi:hypothetical protein
LNRRDALESLEQLLESFLGRAVALKEKDSVSGGGQNRLGTAISTSRLAESPVNRLPKQETGLDQWLTETSMKSPDIDRISDILGGLQRQLGVTPPDSSAPPSTAAEEGQADVADMTKPAPRRIVLKGRAEIAVPGKGDGDTVVLFDNVLARMAALFKDFAGGKKHVLSVLDDTLNSATLQKNKETLLLSAIIIYYLRVEGYKVEPYVRRLKKAELLTKEGSGNA